ncbi:MAG: hypothetical protein DMF22_09240 [Verrucomicrobia bacterium]|nr:MAG: hypothetical protein DMF22_09240 [Verrucomicrobiota bacterium]
MAGKESRVCLSNRDDLPISPGKRFDRPVLVRCFLQASRSATTPKSDREKYCEKKRPKWSTFSFRFWGVSDLPKLAKLQFIIASSKSI